MRVKTLNSFQLEFILGEVKKLERQHPKAKVFYDPEYNGVQVVYPLPRDYELLAKTKIVKEK